MQVISGRTGRGTAQQINLFRKAGKCAVSEALLAGSGLRAEALKEACVGGLLPEPASDSCLLLPWTGHSASSATKEPEI